MNTIRFKIIASMLVILSLSIGAALYGLWRYESSQLIAVARKEAMRSGRTIEKALRASMLKNDRDTIQRSINEISEIVEPPSRISIVGLGGKVGFSSDPAMIGITLKRREDTSCTICHTTQGVIPADNAVMIDTPQGPLLRNVIKIVNQTECAPCHDQADKNLGILLYDAFFADTFRMLNTIAMRILLTGIITFLVVAVVISSLLNRLVHSPISAMVSGLRRVGAGHYDQWLELDASEEFTEMAESFNIMSRAIHRYVTAIKAQQEEIATLYTVVQQISRTIDWREIKKVITDLLTEIFLKADAVLILPAENSADCFDVVWRNPGHDRVSHVRYCTAHDQFPSPLVSKEEVDTWLDKQPTTPQFLDNHTRALIPLVGNNTALGLICVAKRQDMPFTDSEKNLIPAIASHFSISLANARLYHMAITDSLTRLHTKRYLFETLKDLEERDNAAPFSLLIMDLDDFKSVNDTYGHPVGDQILIQLADLIRVNIRFGDLPFRYGGEEFIVVLKGTDPEGATAMETGERLRAAVAEHVFACPDGPALRKTISLGVACFPRHAASGMELISVADQALYEAKRGGKNQVRSPRQPQGGEQQ